MTNTHAHTIQLTSEDGVKLTLRGDFFLRPEMTPVFEDREYATVLSKYRMELALVTDPADLTHVMEELASPMTQLAEGAQYRMESWFEMSDEQDQWVYLSAGAFVLTEVGPLEIEIIGQGPEAEPYARVVLLRAEILPVDGNLHHMALRSEGPSVD